MKFLHKLFGLPDFEDERDSLTADWLLITLLSLVLIFLLIVLNTLLLPENFPFYIWTVVLSILTIMPSYLLLRQGRARLASSVFIIFVLLTVTYTNFVNGGEIRPAVVIYNVFVLIAGLLLGGRGALITAVILALQSSVITLARANGLITLPPPHQQLPQA